MYVQYHQDEDALAAVIYLSIYLYIYPVYLSPTLSAVCHVLVMTSPTLPIAWESEDMALMAPMSCMMSSAAIVSPLLRVHECPVVYGMCVFTLIFCGATRRDKISTM